MHSDERRKYWREKKAESRARGGQAARLREQAKRANYSRRRTEQLRDLTRRLELAEKALEEIGLLGWNVTHRQVRQNLWNARTIAREALDAIREGK